MADNGQLDFLIKVNVMDVISATTIATPPVATITTATAADYIARTIDTFEIKQNDVVYRAEGDANIVLAIPNRCQVLRLPKKIKSEQNICRPKHSTAKECGQNERIFDMYKYIDGVSTVLLRFLTSRPILVRIEFRNVDAFDAWLHNHRPHHRKHSKKDNFNSDYGLLYHDACSLNMEGTKLLRTPIADFLAIEIKPKQGWNICTLPEWILELFEINHGIRNKCRFCAMQHLKVKGQQVRHLSEYCPLDLFSGDVLRMKKSIHNLIANPQNNFRVFANGCLVYSEEYQEMSLQSILKPFFGNKLNATDEFVSLLVNTLRCDFMNSPGLKSIQSEGSNATAQVDEEQLQSHLSHRSILKRILDLQLLAKKTMPHIARKYTNGQYTKNFVKDQQWSHLHITKLCEKLSRIDDNACNNAIDYEYLKTSQNLTDEELYEIGATALDTSIMLTYHNIGEKTSSSTLQGAIMLPLINQNGSHFIANAALIDLDPKFYPRHFAKYVQKTRDSFNAYKLNSHSVEHCDIYNFL